MKKIIYFIDNLLFRITRLKNEKGNNPKELFPFKKLNFYNDIAVLLKVPGEIKYKWQSSLYIMPPSKCKAILDACIILEN